MKYYLTLFLFCSATFVVATSCSTTKVASLPSVSNEITSEPVKRSSLDSSSAPSHIADLGGETRKPTIGCEENYLSTYNSRIIGSKVRLDDWCIDESLQETYLISPDKSMHGTCPNDKCGMASAHRRYPIEHAVLQSITALERSHSMHLSAKDSSYDDGTTTEDISLYFQTIKFDLSPDVHCVSKFEEYEEHHEKAMRKEAEAILLKERKRTGASNYVFHSAKLSSGEIIYKQSVQDDKHEILMIVQTKFEESEEAALLEEKTLCISKKGPINMRDISKYHVWVQPRNAEEWEVITYWNK